MKSFLTDRNANEIDLRCSPESQKQIDNSKLQKTSIY